MKILTSFWEQLTDELGIVKNTWKIFSFIKTFSDSSNVFVTAASEILTALERTKK